MIYPMLIIELCHFQHLKMHMLVTGCEKTGFTPRQWKCMMKVYN